MINCRPTSKLVPYSLAQADAYFERVQKVRLLTEYTQRALVHTNHYRLSQSHSEGEAAAVSKGKMGDRAVAA